MFRHTTSIRLNCPVEQVFAFLVDPRNLPMWQSNLIETALITDGPLRAGSRFRELRMLRGQQAEIQAEVSVFELNRRLATRTLNQPEVTVSYLLSSEDRGTRLDYQFAMQTPGLMRLIAPMILGSIRKESDSDFSKLKQLLES